VKGASLVSRATKEHHVVNDACTDNRCGVSGCDIFDFMAKHVCLTVIHPDGLKATRTLIESPGITEDSKVIDIASGKGSSAVCLAKSYGCNVVGVISMQTWSKKHKQSPEETTLVQK
jgi:cyclopropane fatty-acyl-phospholipid synthase-like methyltransferase